MTLTEKEKQQRLVDFIMEYNRQLKLKKDIEATLKSYSVVPLKYLIPYLQQKYDQNKQIRTNFDVLERK